MVFDIFIYVIDNFGDIGVSCRVAEILKNGFDNCEVRLFCNSVETLKNLLGENTSSYSIFEYSFAESDNLDMNVDIVIEMFGCDIPEEYLYKLNNIGAEWINIEYLTPEPWALDFHNKSSLVQQYPNLKKRFFVPSFYPTTGGLLFSHENGKKENCSSKLFQSTLSSLGIATDESEKVIFIYTYSIDFESLLKSLDKREDDFLLIISSDVTFNSFFESVSHFEYLINDDGSYKINRVRIVKIDFISQTDFDILMCSSYISLIRGEDSFVNSLIGSNVPIWNIYKQEENYHLEKLSHFLLFCEQFFEEKKLFLDFSAFIYALNSNVVEESILDFSLILDSYDDFKKIFKIISNYILNNLNGSDRLIDFIKSRI